MKIESIEAIVLALPYTHEGPLTGFGGHDWPVLQSCLVRVATEDGLVGWGECFGYTVLPASIAVLDNLVAPLAIGRDATDIAGLMEELKRKLHIFGRGGPTQYALSGLDIALWDLAGKRAGLPVAELLGGRQKTAIPAYTSLLKLGEPAIVARGCEKALEQGFRELKLHETTVEAVAAARAALGDDVELMVDVNCPWRFDEALDMAHRFEPYRLKWLEEPVWPPEDVEGLRRLKAAAPVDLAAGENIPNVWAFQPYIDASVLNYVQPSVTKVGGITEMMKVIARAEFVGVRVAPHSPYFGPGLLATLQVAATTPLVSSIECFGVRLGDTVFGPVGLPGADGRIEVPTAPGLGADPDPGAIARLRIN
ncbi:mandelate racemase/muconate lactonizing enzyme family protein [Acuticoccus sediminis]|uniref:Mandelate racemase/muconate lactonizing enzyme family protein n=1 Tax=Acuticoccus sediminis TaxID=2184697 RepID=A0A8B2NIG0_9HYPH|nr:mandelate racemase/muconate lactonizing enzyme family protein [Acuticoccus sediminis]RAH99175.1 mandelate racemase/muconate lactonizing enzyme family protein [Acuticoccus sediminis]